MRGCACLFFASESLVVGDTIGDRVCFYYDRENMDMDVCWSLGVIRINILFLPSCCSFLLGVLLG